MGTRTQMRRAPSRLTKLLRLTKLSQWTTRSFGRCSSMLPASRLVPQHRCITKLHIYRSAPLRAVATFLLRRA
eukprot:170109-Pleurochrysis_carterae.AAC.3